MKLKKITAAIATLLVAGAALADITIGVTLPLTGPASGLGIPMNNQFKLWPTTIAGEKIKLVILDDATDPTNAVKNARRFVTDDKADVIIGSAATPGAIAVADVAVESQTPQLAGSPAQLPPGKDTWTFRLPQSNAVMSHAVVAHMVKQGVKTVGFLGYTDAYGEGWIKDFTPLAEKAGIKVIAAERFARTDTSVTAQALKLVSANPDAMLIVASGSGAAMPHKAVIEERVMLGIALVPERRELFASMSVEDNLVLGGFRQLRAGNRQWRDQMEVVYALFPRLKERRVREAGTLSGGERQMLAVRSVAR